MLAAQAATIEEVEGLEGAEEGVVTSAVAPDPGLPAGAEALASLGPGPGAVRTTPGAARTIQSPSPGLQRAKDVAGLHRGAAVVHNFNHAILIRK